MTKLIELPIPLKKMKIEGDSSIYWVPNITGRSQLILNKMKKEINERLVEKFNPNEIDILRRVQ